MHSKTFGLLVSLGLMSGAGFAAASPVLVGTGDSPTGINGVVVDGLTYDITFALTNVSSPFAALSAASADAATALSIDLPLLGVTGLGGCTSCELRVWVDGGQSGEFAYRYHGGWAAGTSPGPTLLSYGLDTHLVSYGPIYTTAAEWTPEATVPEPATLSIFGLGLAGISFIRKRKAS